MPALAVATLRAASGFEEDNIVNTFAIITPGSFSFTADGGNVTGAIERFYNQLTPTGARIGQYHSGAVSRNTDACTIELYDIGGKLNGDPHGSPLFSDMFTLTPKVGTAADLPEEVAVVLTLASGARELQQVETADGGDAGAEVDRPKQRHTGRLFLGPLMASAGATVNGRFRPSQGYRETVVAAADALQTELFGYSCLWGVWSRKDATVRSISDVWVDDAWDTQRRRGAAATLKTSLNIAP